MAEQARLAGHVQHERPGPGRHDEGLGQDVGLARRRIAVQMPKGRRRQVDPRRLAGDELGAEARRLVAEAAP